MHPKKVNSKNVTEIFLVHFLQFFQRNRNHRDILRFFISFLIFLPKNFFGVILALLQTLKPNEQKTAQKIKKRIL
jgi:hypothetical protein